MKILKRNIEFFVEEPVFENLNELQALKLCEELNNENTEKFVYFQVVTDDYIVWNLK